MEGEVNNSNNKGTDSFRDYLISSKDNMFALDLSGCTLIECINKMCEIKSWGQAFDSNLSPRLRINRKTKGYSGLSFKYI